MEVGYKKDLRNNYMVIEKSVDKEYTPFCIKMLERQEIKGLLMLEQKLIDNKALLYYDITAKQSITNVLEKSTLSLKGLKTLCSGIIHAIENAYEYLLPEDDFILAPDFIYQDITTGSPYLSLYPGYGINIKDQMSSLMEYLMNKVDYNDKDAVYLVYRLYAVSKEEGYTFNHMKEVFSEKGKDQPVNRKSKAEVHINENPARIDSPVIAKNIKEERTSLQNRTVDTSKTALRVAESMKESNIPVVMEKVEGEAEITCYSLVTYLITGGCVLAGLLIVAIGFKSKIIYNSIGTRIDYSKFAALLIILGCVEGYLMSKLLDKKNRITRIVKTKEYVDPRIDYKDYSVNLPISRNQENGQVSSQDKLSDNELESSSPTCLLNASVVKENVPVLKAHDDINYTDIPVTSYPFFIGKLKKNVDYFLDSDTVSRYHAKITKEGEVFYLTDLNSTNGTFINDEPLQTYQRKEIKYGDVITFANIKYLFK